MEIKTPIYAELYAKAEETATSPAEGYTIAGMRPIINERYENLVIAKYGEAPAWKEDVQPSPVIKAFFERKKQREQWKK